MAVNLENVEPAPTNKAEETRFKFDLGSSIEFQDAAILSTSAGDHELVVLCTSFDNHG